MSDFQSRFDPKVHDVVANIPRGHVMSYGQVARKAGFPRHSRMISKAMARCDYKLPWHRVIKADYTLAFPSNSSTYIKQKTRLIEEGCQLLNGKVIPTTKEAKEDLDKLIWGPD